MEKLHCGYELKLTSIGNGRWQLFIAKIDDSSDYVRVVYGVTEQVGGGARKFNIIRSYILTPQTGDDPVFMYEFNDYAMKNRKAWVTLEVVKRQKGKRGKGISTYIGLSPTQSKWRTSIGATTKLAILPLEFGNFNKLFAGNHILDRGFIASLGA